MAVIDYLVVDGPNSVSVREQEAGPLLAGCARVAVAFCGLCRSDTQEIADFVGSPGARFGHEVSGIISEPGPGSPFREGTRVVAMAGDGYATHVDVPCERLIPIPETVSLLDACLTEPTSCILSGLDRLDLVGVERVHIIGSGFMGLLALASLTARGHQVSVIEPRDAARGFAVQLGAAEVLHPSEAETLRDSAELVLECSGTQAGLDLAGSVAAIEAQLSIVGYHQSNGGSRSVDMKSWNYKCLRVINAHIRSENRILLLMRRALAMTAAGTFCPRRLVTQIVGLDDLPQWLSSGGEQETSSIKTVIRCSDAIDELNSDRPSADFAA